MRIAFICSECPVEGIAGGIATYLHEVTLMLERRGHQSLVIGATTRSDYTVQDGLRTFALVRSKPGPSFAARAVDVFSIAHARSPFDVLEGSEWLAEYEPTARRFRDVSLVVKLHTPSFVLKRLARAAWRYDQSWWKRMLIPATHQVRSAMARTAADGDVDSEGVAVGLADLVSAPSSAICALVANEWDVPREKLRLLPLPISSPRQAFVRPSRGQAPVVLFVGRLEVRKGVIDLIDAVPSVLRKCPRAEVWLAGSDEEAPNGGLMSDFLRSRLGSATGSVRFLGKVSRPELGSLLTAASVAVFPSLWESFGYVCLEAMLAGTPVIVSAGTGLEEIVRATGAGFVVQPFSPRSLARAVSRALAMPRTLEEMGERGRKSVLSRYSGDALVAEYEGQYRRACDLRDVRLALT